MSIKTTIRIKPETAREILLSEIPNLPCNALEALMDTLANTEASQRVSIFDNFIVSGFADADPFSTTCLIAFLCLFLLAVPAFAQREPKPRPIHFPSLHAPNYTPRPPRAVYSPRIPAYKYPVIKSTHFPTPHYK